MQETPNYPEIITRLRSLLKSREEKLKKKRNGYSISKLKQTVTMLEYWEAEYQKNGREAGKYDNDHNIIGLPGRKSLPVQK